LNGTINISPGDGFTNGTYTILTYGNTLAWGTPVLGNVPAGYLCSFDTNTAGQVSLLVQWPAPTAPANLTAVPVSLAVNLSWPPSATADSYNLKRSTTNGGPYALLANVAATNYPDAAVLPGTTYYYVVSATNAGGESANSLQAAAIPLPSLVSTNLNFQAGGNQLQFSWPSDHRGWRLQVQTNGLDRGLATNWMDWPGSTNIVQTNIVMNPTNGSVFYRLAYP
jgi:hypothetical protein